MCILPAVLALGCTDWCSSRSSLTLLQTLLPVPLPWLTSSKSLLRRLSPNTNCFDISVKICFSTVCLSLNLLFMSSIWNTKMLMSTHWSGVFPYSIFLCFSWSEGKHGNKKKKHSKKQPPQCDHVESLNTHTHTHAHNPSLLTHTIYSHAAATRQAKCVCVCVRPA